MSRDHLDRASELLSETSNATSGDPSERLRKQADELADLATRDRGPDHGRLDRHMNILRQIKEDVDEEPASSIDDALEHITEYRKTVEGV